MLMLQVRPDDCDSFGHVNNAAYASFVQLAVVEALRAAGHSCDWTGEGAAMCRLASLSIEYRSAAHYGEDLGAHPWLEAAGPQGWVFGCEIRGVGMVRARSRSCWQVVERTTGKPLPQSEQVLAALPMRPGAAAKPPAQFGDRAGVHTYLWHHRLMQTELDPFGGAHIRAIYTWLEEAIFHATSQAGWPLERWKQAGFVTLQARHDTDFFSMPRPDDDIEVACRLVDVRRLMGTWLVQVHRRATGEILVRDYSTGVFLDLSGRPAAPPPQIAEDLQTGGFSSRAVASGGF